LVSRHRHRKKILPVEHLRSPHTQTTNEFNLNCFTQHKKHRKLGWFFPPTSCHFLYFSFTQITLVTAVLLLHKLFPTHTDYPE
jgi:hypothetical protein